MFCSKCGSQIPDGTKFCPQCGADLSYEKKLENAANDIFNSAEKEVGSAFEEVKQSFTGATGSAGQAGNAYANGGPSAYCGERLKDDRGIISYILLSIVTCGIYNLYFIYKLGHDTNIACEGDGENTAGLLAFILLSFITCGIYSWIWYYKLGNRLASAAPRYGLSLQENGTTVLLWMLFGVFLCGIGPLVAMHIIMKNTNKICNAYNRSHGL